MSHDLPLSSPSDPPPWVPAPGERFANRYVIQSLSAQSPDLAILDATDLSSSQAVQVHLLRHELPRETRELFLRAATRMGSLQHPNIATVSAEGATADQPFAITHIDAATPLTATAGENLAKQFQRVDEIIEATSALHEAGITHQSIDVADFVMVNGHAVLRTFGSWGLSIRPLTHRARMIPLAPEASLGLDLPPSYAQRTDVFSLGGLALWLFTDAQLAQARDLRVKLEASTTTLPPLAAAAIEGAIHEDPLERTPSAKTLRQAFIDVRRRGGTRPDQLRILILDPQIDFLDFAADVFSKSFPGVGIVPCTSGAAAIIAISQLPCSIAIVDLHNPGMNGVELIAALRTSDHGKNLPVVITTEREHAHDWETLSRLGANAHVAKPADEEALVSVVRSILSETEQSHRIA